MSFKDLESDLYRSGEIRRPKMHPRLEALAKLPFYWATEHTLRALPESGGRGYIPQLYNTWRQGLAESAQIMKHNCGKTAFKAPKIPILGKVVQNFWSLGYLSGGVSDMRFLYTVERGGREHLLHIEVPGNPRTLAELHGIANGITGNEQQYAMGLIGHVPRYANLDAAYAGVYDELTDEDIREVADVKPFPGYYLNAELWFMGRAGRRTVVGNTPAGERIVMYERPGRGSFLRFFGEMDLAYTVYDGIIGDRERLVGDAAARQRLYEGEVRAIIGGTRQRYGETREDGFQNPISNYM